MNKKIILPVIIVLLVALAIVGYLAFNQSDAPLSQEESAVTKGAGLFKGTVVAVDLDPVAYDGPALITLRNEEDESIVVAVPSMGLPLCASYENMASPFYIEAGDIVSVKGNVDPLGRIVPCEDSTHYLTATKIIRDETFGYQFSYERNPVGYIAIDENESQDPDFLYGIILFDRNEYEAFQENTDAREGPPAIHVRVYSNSEKMSAFDWPQSNPLASNINLALAEPSEATIDGANAAYYVVDGLYPTETYVIAHGQYIYVLSGSYLEKDSNIYKGFQSIIDSFTFIPIGD